MVPARVARLAADVLEAVLHHPPPAELGPAPRPVAREDVAEQVRDEQHAAALHVAPQVIKGHAPELERASLNPRNMRWLYAQALYKDPVATLDDLREALTTLEDSERIARRVFGGANPTTTGIETALRQAQAALRARETPPSNA